MNNKFDELTKAMAQSVTRRAALKQFGIALTGMALACFGLAGKAHAGSVKCAKYGDPCATNADCCSGLCGYGGTCRCVTIRDCPNPRPKGLECFLDGVCGYPFP
jgi:hypothetical protein